jgi:NAD(P)-dependent dehydrogenase (short-subunit alcohol dehydrogenase family)
LDQLAQRLEADGAEVLIVEADVTDEAAARGAVEQTIRRFGDSDRRSRSAVVGDDPRLTRRMKVGDPP